jgi:hypothetical protein
MPKLKKKPKVKWQGLKPNPSKFFGFIYEICNTVTGTKYIGKKQYHMLNPKRSRRRPVCDTTGDWNPDHWKASDWETYTGSCRELNADVAKLGHDKFTFHIIGQYSTKGDLSYAEVEAIIKKDAMIKRGEEGLREYYNGNVSAIRFIPPNKTKEIL